MATQRAALATVEKTVPELEQTQREATAALAALLGRPPEGFSITGGALESLQEPVVGPGLPSELLRRRPDVFTAEANLQSASADVVAARAALFPSLSLTAAGGVQNPALNAAITSLSGVGPTLNLGASITQPIFNAGRLRAARDEARAKEQELATSYRSAIVAALVDVENSLSAIHHLNAARAFEEETVAQSERAFEGARLRYKAGNGDFLSVLEAQRTLYAVRDQYSPVQARTPAGDWSASVKRWAAVGRHRTRTRTPNVMRPMPAIAAHPIVLLLRGTTIDAYTDINSSSGPYSVERPGVG